MTNNLCVDKLAVTGSFINECEFQADECRLIIAWNTSVWILEKEKEGVWFLHQVRVRLSAFPEVLLNVLFNTSVVDHYPNRESKKHLMARIHVHSMFTTVFMFWDGRGLQVGGHETDGEGM